MRKITNTERSRLLPVFNAHILKMVKDNITDELIGKAKSLRAKYNCGEEDKEFLTWLGRFNDESDFSLSDELISYWGEMGLDITPYTS